jgi:hypothetical protein
MILIAQFFIVNYYYFFFLALFIIDAFFNHIIKLSELVEPNQVKTRVSSFYCFFKNSSIAMIFFYNKKI